MKQTQEWSSMPSCLMVIASLLTFNATVLGQGSLSSPYRSTRAWQAYDGGSAPLRSSPFDVPFMAVSNTATAEALRIAGDGEAASIYFSAKDADVVRVAANALGNDIQRVTGISPTVSTTTPIASEAVLVGTVGSSPLIDGLIAAGKIDVTAIQGKWEAYTAIVVDDPMKGVERALIITGSDRRGTAFGVFALSESMGVSPWYWWGDVATPQKDALYIAGSHTQSSPGVKYRGIFLNDEDWGLQPWAANTFEPEVGNIGPKTYATIYELLLRLQANCIWPAMHEYPVHTTPFYLVPGNMEMADTYAIVISTSHHEPMLRNSHEYNEDKLGDYDYWANRKTLYNFWDQRVKETASFENIYTIGMRGRSDAGMLAPEGTSIREKALKIQNEIIPDQRSMLARHVNKDPSEIPQIFIPYKETLVQYQAGLQLPDDVTILWPDDNHGYIRQLSSAAERARSGGSGVYYHLSYWGAPLSYLWFYTTPPGVTCVEMMKAWDFEARNMWIVNVGDLKPAEIGMEFFLRMARNPEAFRKFDQTAYFEQWASRTFGPAYAADMAAVLNDYFHLNIVKRPEHLNRDNSGFSLVKHGDEAQRRLAKFAALTAAADSIYNQLPAAQKPAFYEMVLYPVRASYYVNKRTLDAERSRLWARQKRAATEKMAKASSRAHDMLIEEIRFYNAENAGGKWKHMISPMESGKFRKNIHYTSTQSPFVVPSVGQYSPSSKASLGVAIEGAASLLRAGKPGALPVFNRLADSSYFMDIFNQGKVAAKWTVLASESWIKLSQANGEADARIQVSIDWDAAPVGDAIPGTVTIRSQGSTWVVKLLVCNPAGLDVATLPKAVENNGVVIIEAEDYTKRSDSNDGVGWRRFDRAAASRDGMTIQPFRAKSLNIKKLPADAPSLTYEFHTFSSGSVQIITQCLPTQRITSDHTGARYAISLNGDAPRIVDINTTEYSSTWRANTLRAASLGSSTHNITKPGRQKVQIWMVDAGVVLDRLDVTISSGSVALETYEAEDLKVHRSNTKVQTYNDSPASEGQGLAITATAKKDFATLVVPAVTAGKYELSGRAKKGDNRGVVQVAIAEHPDGPFKNIGSQHNLYSPKKMYIDLKCGVQNLSDGPKYLRFTVTGKKGKSKGYNVLLDTITLKPARE